MLVRIAVVLLLFALLPAAAHAQRRVALVIGNSAYQHTPKLENPRNDAADVGAALKKLGFQVIEGFDLDKASLDRKIRDFATAIAGADVGLFFYAGHGLQVAGQNYIVPVDAQLTNSAGLDFEMVRLELVHRTMERESKTNVIFLDACRDNPLARNLARAMGTRTADIGKGLAAVESGVGTLISFSTQPGNVALDGEGRNSPYAAALVKQLAESKEDLSTLLIQVRNSVMSATKERQIPWEHSSLRAKFYFSAPAAARAEPVNPSVPSSPNYDKQTELVFWNTVKDLRDPAAIQAYIDAYPTGAFVPLARILVDKLKREAEQTAVVTTREAGVRKAEEDLSRKAAEGRQAEELRNALEEARKAREALAAAEKERQVAMTAAEQARSAAAAAQAERGVAAKYAEKSLEPIEVGKYYTFGRRTCEPRPPPRAAIRNAPRHARIVFKSEFRPLTRARPGNEHCMGTNQRMLVVYYVPSGSPVPDDRVSYLLHYPDGMVRHRDCTVNALERKARCIEHDGPR